MGTVKTHLPKREIPAMADNARTHPSETNASEFQVGCSDLLASDILR